MGGSRFTKEPLFHLQERLYDFAMRRFMAIYTYHSEEAKEAIFKWGAENIIAQKEFIAAQVFEKCRTVAT